MISIFIYQYFLFIYNLFNNILIKFISNINTQILLANFIIIFNKILKKLY
jgi:hypothetical protein